jgi:hypothetical protein
VMRDTSAFPGDTFARSAAGAERGVGAVVLFPMERFPSFAAKLVRGSAASAGSMAAMLGLAVLPFALVGALYRFKIPSVNAVRGFAYVTVLTLLAVFALFSTNSQCTVIFLPVFAVLASAYFYLLADAKNLHVVYYRALVGGLVLVSLWPALGASIWSQPPASAANDPSAFFMRVATDKGMVYTDAPWLLALRTDATGVWLPSTDSDCEILASKQMPLQMLCLTPEADNYPSDEVWYLLRHWRFWRDCIRDPESFVRLVSASYCERARSQPRPRGFSGDWPPKVDGIATWLRGCVDARRRACVVFSPAVGLARIAMDDAPGSDGSDPLTEGMMLFVRPKAGQKQGASATPKP